METGVIEDMGVGELLLQAVITRQGLATQVPKGRPREPPQLAGEFGTDVGTVLLG